MSLKEVSAKAFARDVIRADRPVLVHFHAAWCKQSLLIGPIVEKLSKEMAKEVKVVRVASDSKKLMARLNVSRFPTQMLFVDGQQVDQILGPTTEASLRGMVKDGIAMWKRSLAAEDGAAKTPVVVDANFGRLVLQSERPVLAVFWSKACAGSLKLLDHINEVAATAKKTKMKVVAIEAERVPATASRLQVTRFPTSLVFEDGAVVDMLGGVISPKSIGSVFKAYA